MHICQVSVPEVTGLYYIMFFSKFGPVISQLTKIQSSSRFISTSLKTPFIQKPLLQYQKFSTSSILGQKKKAKKLDLEYLEIPPDRIQEVVDIYCKLFIPSEPTSLSLGLNFNPSDAYDLFLNDLVSAMEDRLSIMAVDKKNNGIAGICLNHKNGLNEWTDHYWNDSTKLTKNQKDLVAFLNELYKDLDTKGCTKLFTLDTLYTSPLYQNQGVGLKLVKKSEKLAKEKGFELFMVHASSKFIFYNIFKKLKGYEVIKELDIGDFKFPDGYRLPKNQAGVHCFHRVLVKKL